MMRRHVPMDRIWKDSVVPIEKNDDDEGEGKRRTKLGERANLTATLLAGRQMAFAGQAA